MHYEHAMLRSRLDGRQMVSVRWQCDPDILVDVGSRRGQRAFRYGAQRRH
jgi:hypothetical protein